MDWGKKRTLHTVLSKFIPAEDWMPKAMMWSVKENDTSSVPHYDVKESCPFTNKGLAGKGGHSWGFYLKLVFSKLNPSMVVGTW